MHAYQHHWCGGLGQDPHVEQNPQVEQAVTEKMKDSPKRYSQILNLLDMSDVCD